MENLKNPVQFNRYKSVESFNNATDITSSTLSIVKLDDNIMEIYLGRTKISDSNLLKENIELRNLIDSLSISIKEIYSDVDSIRDIKTKQNSQSQSIFDIKNDIKSLKSEDIHIFEILGEINKKISNLTDNDVIPSISDITTLKQNIDVVLKELLNKIKNNQSEINKLKAKYTSVTEDISIIEKNIKALQEEDIHIFEIINGLQYISKTIMSDIKFIKNDNKNINDEIISLKEKIRLLTGVNVDNIETLEGAHRRLTKLEKSDKEFQTKIDEIDSDIKKGFATFATKEYVDDKVDGKFDASGTAADLNAVMDERVTALEKINHSDYVTEEKLESKGYLTSDIADKKYAPIGTTGSGENIDLNDYATIEYVKETYAKKSDIPKLEWINL